MLLCLGKLVRLLALLVLELDLQPQEEGGI